MNTRTIRSCSALVAGLFLASPLIAQPALKIQFPAPSPTCTLTQRVGLTDVGIVYSRPSAKGREIIGGLVPYDAVWRTGANASTKVTFSTDVKLNGVSVPAGTYALYTIPGKKAWTIIISKDTGPAGFFGYSQTNDLARFEAVPVKLREPVETFAIEINDIRDDSATLNLIWEKTRVPVKLQTDLVSKLAPQIEAVMAAPGEKKPYYPAAMFYYDHGLDLTQAKKWIDAAVAANETYYVVHLRAQILAKLGDKAGAIAAANRSTELAIKAEGPKSGYVKVNKDLISSLR